MNLGGSNTDENQVQCFTAGGLVDQSGEERRHEATRPSRVQQHRGPGHPQDEHVRPSPTVLMQDTIVSVGGGRTFFVAGKRTCIALDVHAPTIEETRLLRSKW